jgi:hypothetical protein
VWQPFVQNPLGNLIEINSRVSKIQKAERMMLSFRHTAYKQRGVIMFGIDVYCSWGSGISTHRSSISTYFAVFLIICWHRKFASSKPPSNSLFSVSPILLVLEHNLTHTRIFSCHLIKSRYCPPSSSLQYRPTVSSLYRCAEIHKHWLLRWMPMFGSTLNPTRCYGKSAQRKTSTGSMYTSL